MRTLILFLVICVSPLLLARDMVTLDDSFTIRTDRLRLDIDIDGAELEVKKGDSRRDVHVYMRYNARNTEGNIRYNENRGTMDITVDTDIWDMDNDGKGNNAPKVVVELPDRPEIEIEARIKAGEITFELGDLNIADFILKNWAGETKVNFEQPNKMTMRTFDVNCKIGEISLLNLGNARFESGRINAGIGELTLDFHGDALDKCVADIDLDLGETRIVLPREAGVKMRVSKFLFLNETSMPHWFIQRGDYHYSENFDDADKSLLLAISSGIGELSVQVD